MPQIEIRGEIEQVKQRLKSLLNSSGLQVFGESSDSLRFRKVRLTPSGRLPLSIYGSGVVKLDTFGKGSTRVTYSLNTSPATIFSFAVTALSIVILAAFIDYLLLTAGAGMTSEVIVDLLVVNLVSLLVILLLILSFIRTKKRAERFLCAFLEASSGVTKSKQ